jgi:hypothetical protein
VWFSLAFTVLVMVAASLAAILAERLRRRRRST